MDDEKPAAVDLFGNPWTLPRDGRGRKRHKRSAEVAEKVAVLRAAGMLVEDIATRAGLSEPTLRKYYFRELEQGGALAKGELNLAMWEKAKGGNVGAAKFMEAQFTKGQSAVPVARRAKAEPAAPAPRGLKAQQKHDAQQAPGGEWGTLLPH